MIIENKDADIWKFKACPEEAEEARVQFIQPTADTIQTAAEPTAAL